MRRFAVGGWLAMAVLAPAGCADTRDLREPLGPAHSVRGAAATIGGRVTLRRNAGVRPWPGREVVPLGTQPAGASGTIAAGPAWDTDGRKWWDVDFDSGVDGWVIDGRLVSALVAAVAASPVNLAVAPAATAQLTATAWDAAGTLISVPMTWTSRDTTIARVSAAGLVTGFATGATLIVAASGGVADTVAVAVTPRAGWYAAPAGMSGNDGSYARPWDLATALTGGGGRVRPGDTVWMLGGTYRGAFRATLAGTATAPVTVRQYPGARAIIDNRGSTSSALTVTGSYTVWRDFELTNTEPVRTVSFTGNGGRTHAIYNRADFTRYVNLVVHDAGVAFYSEPVHRSVEITGSIFYNNGWQGPDRGHGHALYLKSDAGPVLARDNVIFHQYGYGIHVYSNPGSGAMNNITLEGNIAFDNGTLALSPSPNILMGGGDRADGAVVRDNVAWESPGLSVTNVRIGSGSVMNGGVTVSGNVIAGGSTLLEVGYWTTASFSGNTLTGSGAIRWYNTAMPRPASLAAALAPLAPQVVVRPNRDEAGRAHVAVLNWPRQAAVSVSLGQVLAPGDSFEIRNVQRLFGAALVAGRYAGAVVLPMTGVTPPVPVGLSVSRAPVSGPLFDVFLVVRK